MSNIDGLNQYSLSEGEFRHHKPIENGLYCEVADVVHLLKERDKEIRELKRDLANFRERAESLEIQLRERQ